MNKEENIDYINSIHDSYIKELQKQDEYIKQLQQQCKQQKEVIDMFLNIVNKSKMLLNNPDLLDLYFKIKRCQNE